MKQLILAISFLLLLSLNIFGQGTDTTSTVPDTSPSGFVAIKTSPLSLLDTYMTLYLGIEYKISRNFTLQHDLGYVFGSWHTDSDSKGIKARSELKGYMQWNDRGGWYLGGELFYHRYRFSRFQTVEFRDDFTNDVIYYKYIDFKSTKEVVGYHFKLGKEWMVNKIVLIEIYTGFGLRHIMVNDDDKSMEGNYTLYKDEEVCLFCNEDKEGDRTSPSISAGLKIGLRIK